MVFGILSFFISLFIQCKANQRLKIIPHHLLSKISKSKSKPSVIINFIKAFLVNYLALFYVRIVYQGSSSAYDKEIVAKPIYAYFVTFCSNISYLMLSLLTLNLNYNQAYYPNDFRSGDLTISMILYKIGSSNGKITLYTGILSLFQGAIQGTL